MRNPSTIDRQFMRNPSTIDRQFMRNPSTIDRQFMRNPSTLTAGQQRQDPLRSFSGGTPRHCPRVDAHARVYFAGDAAVLKRRGLSLQNASQEIEAAIISWPENTIINARGKPFNAF